MKTRKFISAAVLAVVMAFIEAIPINAYDFTSTSVEGQTLWFNILSSEEATCEVTYSGSSYMFQSWYWNHATVTFPSEVTYNDVTYTVTRIGDNALRGTTNVKQWNLPSTLTTIGDYAFASTNMTSITIPENVTTIGKYAFQDSKVKEIILPSSLTTIGSYAFYKTTSLLSMTIPEGVTTIEAYAFNLSNIAEIELPNTLTTIGEKAFYESNLVTLELPESVTVIGDYAFSNSKLVSFSFGNCGVTTVPNYMFQNCESLKTVTLSNQTTTIGTYAFNGTGLVTITIPASVTRMNMGAFKDCPSLETVVMQGTCALVSSLTFNGSTSATLYVPESLLTTFQTTSYWSNNFPDRIKSYPESMSMNLNKSAMTMRVGQTNLLSVSATPSGYEEDFVWTSSNPLVARRGADGAVTALTSGTTEIAVNYAIYSAACTVNVVTTEISMASVHNLIIGETASMNAIVTPVMEDEVVISWTTSNPAVAIVDENGIVTAVGEGTARITGQFAEATEYCTVNVGAERVKLKPAMNMVTGQEYKMSVRVFPEPTLENPVVWASSNPSVVSIDEDGFITAHATGDAEISATYEGVTKACHVQVIEYEITLQDAPTKAMRVNEERQLYVTMDWVSSNLDVATVDEHGVVTGVSEGTAIISARAIDGSHAQASCEVSVLQGSGATGNTDAIPVREDGKYEVQDLNGKQIFVADNTLVLRSLKPAIYVINGKKIRIGEESE